MYDYYLQLFPPATAVTLVNIFSLIYGLGGAVAVVTFGLVADRLDVRASFLFLDALALVFAVAVVSPSFGLQIVAQASSHSPCT